jgi:hypothetical protein
VLGERAEVLAAVALVLRESRRVVAEPSLSPEPLSDVRDPNPHTSVCDTISIRR